MIHIQINGLCTEYAILPFTKDVNMAKKDYV